MTYVDELEKQNEELRQKLAKEQENNENWTPSWDTNGLGEWHYECNNITFGIIRRKYSRTNEQAGAKYEISLIEPIESLNNKKWTPYLTLQAAKDFIERSFVRGGNYSVPMKYKEDE